MNAAEAQLHQMSRRHHATMQKLSGINAKIDGLANRAYSTLETGAGAWLGGLLSGFWRTGALSLVFGGGFLLLGYTNVAGERYSGDYVNIGNGFLAAYLSRAGYGFGSRLMERSATKIAEQRQAQRRPS